MSKPKVPAVERRYVDVATSGLELRAAGNEQHIVGHAAVFNELSQNLGGFVERILPGAFSQSIQEDNPVALWQHDTRYVLGRVSAGTLRLSEDATGLWSEITPSASTLVRDMVLTPIERGDVTQMSIGFRVLPDGEQWSVDEQGRYIRTLTKVKLFDVSPVTFPAYPQTDVAVRSFEDFLASEAEKAAAITEQQRREQEQLVATARRRLRIAGAE